MMSLVNPARIEQKGSTNLCGGRQLFRARVLI